MDIAGVIGDVFIAVFQVGIPAAVASYCLVWWALKHDYFGGVSSLKELEKSAKNHTESKKAQKKERKKLKKALFGEKTSDSDILQIKSESTEIRELNPVHNKWLTFGGGFYGVMALLTYTIIELAEIRDFLANFTGIIDFLTGMSLELLIGLLVNSVVNLVAAVTWPLYWLNHIDSSNPWIWFVLAWIGYVLGARLAFRQHNKSQAALNDQG